MASEPRDAASRSKGSTDRITPPSQVPENPARTEASSAPPPPPPPAAPVDQEQHRDVRPTVVKILTVLLGALLLSIVFPAAAAKLGGVGHREGVVQRMREYKGSYSLAPDADTYARFLNSEKERRPLVEKIDSHLASAPGDAASADGITKLADARRAVTPKAIRPLFTVTGFLDSEIPALWFLDLIFVGCLAVVAVPLARNLWRSALKWGAVWFVVQEAPPFCLRYFGSRTFDQGRGVFAYDSWDVHRLSFIATELCALVDAVLLVAIILALIQELGTPPEPDIRVHPGPSPAVQDLATASRRLSDDFGQWKVRSFLLAGAFLPWTYFDWSSLQGASAAHVSTTRYAYMAIFDHIAWVAIWALLSVPALRSFAKWRSARLDVAVEATTAGDEADALKAILDTDNVSHPHILGAAITAIVAVLVPVLALFR